jgi:hypothetical protein
MEDGGAPPAAAGVTVPTLAELRAVGAAVGALARRVELLERDRLVDRAGRDAAVEERLRATDAAVAAAGAR